MAMMLGTYPTTEIGDFILRTGWRAIVRSWTLHVSDQWAGDDGVLNSWGIRQSSTFLLAEVLDPPLP